MTYKSYENDSVALDPSSPFYLHHVTRYWWASGFANGKSVLDCACGHGYGTFILSRVAESALGVDLNPGSLEVANAAFSAPNLSYLECDVLELAKLGRTFDLITSFEVIEHIPPETTDLFLRSLASLLNPNGRILLSTPNHDVVVKSGVTVPDFHINNFPATKLRSTLRRHFRDVEMLGQFEKKRAPAGLVFDVDYWNLRHVIGRPLGKILGSLWHTMGHESPVTVTEAQRPLEAREARRRYEAPPVQMKDFAFSPHHWRQAGLTVAVCSHPVAM